MIKAAQERPTDWIKQLQSDSHVTVNAGVGDDGAVVFDLVWTNDVSVDASGINVGSLLGSVGVTSDLTIDPNIDGTLTLATTMQIDAISDEVSFTQVNYDLISTIRLS